MITPFDTGTVDAFLALVHELKIEEAGEKAAEVGGVVAQGTLELAELPEKETEQIQGQGGSQQVLGLQRDRQNEEDQERDALVGVEAGKNGKERRDPGPGADQGGAPAAQGEVGGQPGGGAQQDAADVKPDEARTSQEQLKVAAQQVKAEDIKAEDQDVERVSGRVEKPVGQRLPEKTPLEAGEGEGENLAKRVG